MRPRLHLRQFVPKVKVLVLGAQELVVATSIVLSPFHAAALFAGGRIVPARGARGPSSKRGDEVNLRSVNI